jgi:hypothetical protein
MTRATEGAGRATDACMHAWPCSSVSMVLKQPISDPSSCFSALVPAASGSMATAGTPRRRSIDHSSQLDDGWERAPAGRARSPILLSLSSKKAMVLPLPPPRR